MSIDRHEQHSRRTVRRRSFTLIELLVVIGIIALLTALLVSVSTALAQRSEVREIETAMKNLDNAVQEYELAADRQISYQDTNATGPHYDIQEPNNVGPDMPIGADDDFEMTHQLLELLNRNSASAGILSKISENLLGTSEDDDHLRLIDPWGTEVLTVMPGRVWDGGAGPQDPDGTIRTAFEARFGIAPSRTIYFVSAGPDGDFGDPSAGSGTPAFEDARDNVYSDEPEQP